MGPSPIGKVQAVANQKGGVGPQASLTYSCGVDPDTLERSMHEVLLGRATAADVGGADGPAELRLLTSRDGVTWSDESVDELLGEPATAVARVTVTADRAVVMAVPRQERRDGEHLRQVALVATAR